MGNAQQIESLAVSHLTTAKALYQPSYIFNEHSVAALKSRVIDALSVLSQRFETLEKPFSGITPQHMAKKFADVDLSQPQWTFTAALDELKELYLKDAVYFHNPNYMAHLNCPIVYPAIVAELILSAVNSSLDTWDQSAGATLIEQRLLDWTSECIRFGEAADGVFTSGGTQSNLMAMLIARDEFCRRKLNHDVKTNGLPSEFTKFKIFVSEASHFSLQKSAAILGLGYESIVSVPTDEHYRMNVAQLKAAIDNAREAGEIPVAVIATAGTTDFGSIDPLHEISKVAHREALWMHVDAAYGGGLLISNQYRDRIDGIELADSVTIDFHKTFFQPVSCGAFFVKNKKHLSCVTHHADYLNPLSQSQEGTPNLVNKSIQTTRRFDALKLWMSLRTIGAEQLGQYFDQVIELAQKVECAVRNDLEIEVLNKPELSAIVFRFLSANKQNLCTINQEIRKQLFKDGQAIIAGTKVKGESYLKITLLNPEASLEQVLVVFERIKRLGRQLSHQYNQQNQS
ncbi:pyridoxal phosphate-dependent decarboxylase family protein [Pleionea litopenaei]|uniref:Aspartate aminotransferase family protein n=1 Tax=Pleionea litopenaei TaxID=3070815 RepID=A0AA51RSE7_9GAMM|nr:aspartate aminotransferase family protein [Pleionea sp. HL-JVS1]WMS86746.1 aspartate aminotransferase family protein [Pleionea sp. HL-JVS1]